MNTSRIAGPLLRKLLLALAGLALSIAVNAADHNDPNGVNSIFSDIAISPGDLYGMFGYPADDKSNGEHVVVQLTFASIPGTGVFDQDFLYRIHLDADPRIDLPAEATLDGLIAYADAVKDKYFQQEAAEVRVSFNGRGQAKVDFLNFPGGDFSRVLDTNRVLDLQTPGGQSIKAFVGGRDDPFFNDLPGFFRSINYGPQFYKIPVTADMGLRELPIPKTLLELEDNTLFNFDPAHPRHGQGVKFDLPDGPHDWQGNRFKKDADGNYRFVYSGRDAQAGINVNALVFEVPLAYITQTPDEERVVRIWGESWVLKASEKAKKIPDRKVSWWQRFLGWFKGAGEPAQEGEFNSDIGAYKIVDVVGVPFLDAALNERVDERQGHNNLHLVRRYVMRFAHLGWGFGPSVDALGLRTCFDHDNSPVSVHKTYALATPAFPRVKKCFFQRLHMPDDSWNNSGKSIKERRTFEIFIPNVTTIDMDTTGTWPFGRRPEDQVATRFLSTFLDMEEGCAGRKCNIETLGDLALWGAAPVSNKNPPNPLKNDKPFLDHFPYLAEPW
jgi:hypothetical protein